MAGLAALRETAPVRIAVAIRTLTETNSGVARLVVRSWRVAFLTSHLCVQTSQRITRPRMIELSDRDRLPIDKTMAL